MFMTVFANTNDSSQSSNEFWSIINHPCFDQKNAHDCQQWNYMNNSEQCMWCEYWCIHQLNGKHLMIIENRFELNFFSVSF